MLEDKDKDWGITKVLSDEFISAFDAMAAEVHGWARRKGWWDNEILSGQRRNDAELIALMHSELSEALEALREKDGFPNREHLGAASDKIPEFLGIEEEYADAIIRIMDHAHARGLNIGEALVAKMFYNEGRPYRHGNKRY
jgi:NTP pyrophosphatase (non-canonical NTP hydrolase)